MKILILSQYWFPENGVPQRRWTWLSSVLSEAGHEVTVVAPPPHYKRRISLSEWYKERGFSPSDELTEGCSGEMILRTGYFPSGKGLTRRIFNQGWNAIGMARGVRKLRHRKRYHPDLVIGTVPAIPTSAVTFYAACKFRKPYIIDLRDAWPALFDEKRNWNEGTGKKSLRERVLSWGAFPAMVWATKRCLNYVLRRSSCIVTTSEWLSRDISADLRIPSFTVRNVFPSAQCGTSALVAEKSDSLNVLYAGTLGRAQKLENAVSAAKLAADEGVTVKIRLIGDGAAWESIAHRAAELGVHVEMVHQKKPEDLAEDYAWADTALVHLTDWASLKWAVPSKTYELMTNQIHITGVVTGETAHLIESFDAGDVVPPGKPGDLARLWIELANDRQRLAVGPRGKEWVELERNVRAPENFLRAIAAVGDKR